MSRLRAVLAGVVTTAVLVVMPGGWTAFADDQIPDAPGGVLNEEWSPPATADEGSQDVGQVPEEKWTLVEAAEEPAPEAAPTEEPAPERGVTKAPAAKTVAPVAPVAPKSEATAEAAPEAGSTESPAPEGTETPAPAESTEASQEATVSPPAPEETSGDAAADKSLSQQGVLAAPAQPEAQQLSATSAVYPAPGIGALPWFTFDQVNVTTDTLARVNLGNGNLLLTGNNGTLTGPGLGVRNDRFYNSLSTHEGALGTGWSSALSANDVGLQVTSTTATYRGPNGYEAVFTKNGSSWVAPAGFKAALTADGTGWKLVYDGSGEIIKFNSNGWITNYTDRNSVGATYNYTNGQLSGVTQASGRSFSVQYESWNTALVYRITDSAGRVTTYGHDTNSGQLKWVIPPGDVWEYYTYNGDGLLSQIKWRSAGDGDALVNFTYDSSRRVTKIEQTGSSNTAITGSTTYAYNAGQTLVTNGNGKTTSYEVDSSGRVLSATDPLGNKRAQTYNARNDIATSTDALGSGNTPGNQTAYSYDSLGNATGATLPTGAAASATYALGNGCTNTGGTATQIKCSTDPSGNGKRYDYDSAGNATKITDTTSGGTGVVMVEKSYAGGGYGCNSTPAKNGQVCSTKDGNGNTTRYKYNSSGDLVRVEPPSPMGATVYAYDSLGRVTSVTDGNGDVTSYAYNQRDEVVETTFDNSSKMYTKWYYNGLKERDSQSTDNTGPLEIWNYDSAGRAVKVITVSNIGPGLNTVIFNYTYDVAGNTLSAEETNNGKITYGYDDANRLVTLADPDQACPAGTSAPAASGCTRFAYNANGAEVLRTFQGNATVATTRDNAGRATRITAKDGTGATKVDIGYTFTAPGGSGVSADRTNIQTRTAYLEQGITAGAVTTYSYDSLNRLKLADEKVGPAANASWAYSYDNAGNRTKQVRTGNTGAAAGTIDTTYNAANQITGATGSNGSWTYDAVGNQTRNALTGVTSSFNDRGAVTGIGSSTYTAWKQGNTNTLTRTNGSTTNGYLVSPTGLVMSGSTGASQRRAYTRTPDGELTTVRYFEERYSFVKDSLGSVVGAFNRNGSWQGGYSYSPYGETRSTFNGVFTNDNPIRYISGYWDATVNQYRLGARYYDPSLARFSQADPSGQEANPYAYSFGNPVNYSDPTGLTPGTDLLGGVFDFFGYLDLARAAIDGDSRQTAIELVKIGVGAVTATICAGLTAGIVTGPWGLAAAGLGCLAVEQFVSNAVVGFE